MTHETLNIKVLKENIQSLTCLHAHMHYRNGKINIIKIITNALEETVLSVIIPRCWMTIAWEAPSQQAVQT